MTDKKRLVILLGHNGNDDKSTVAFTIANAALSKGDTDVAVFLTSDGVEVSREGSHDLTHVQPFKKLEELIDNFVEKGGILWACSPCFQHRGLKQEQTVQRTIVTGAGPMLEWIAAGASTLSL